MRSGGHEAVLRPVRVGLPGGLWPAESDGAPIRELGLRALADDDQPFVLDTRGLLPPAARATALLARCVEGGESTADALAVGDREALLLHLRRLTFGETMDCVLRCPEAACGKPMEFSLRIGELLVPPYPEMSRSHSLRIEDGAWEYSVTFRVPTAADLDAAAAFAAEDAERGASELLQRCVIRADRDGSDCEAAALPAAVREAIAAAMARHDPQAELELDLSCPNCGNAFSVVFDAAAFLLQEIDDAAAGLLRQVHILASHYGWSEDEILRIPAARRVRYLELVAASAARVSPR
jgi:hypothetical protein